MKKPLALIVFVAAVAMASPASAANIVLDPSFELGYGLGWTYNGWFIADYTGHTGSNSAVTGGCRGDQCVHGSGSEVQSLQQTLATIAGQTYDLSFWEAENAGPTSELVVN